MKQSKQSRAKASAIAEARAHLRLAIMAYRGPFCEACGLTPVGKYPARQWTDMHEILTRGRGGSPTDPDNILCLCRDCHEWVTTHEEEARKLGLVRAQTAEEHRARYRPWE